MNPTNAPQWLQVQQALRDALARGEFPPGSKLPTEQALSERFGIHRHTLRKAVNGLVEEGLVRTEQGRGMFAEELALDYLIGRRTRFTENVQRQNRSKGRKILKRSIEVADAKVAKGLGIRKGSKVLYLHSLSELDEKPVGLSETWFNRRLCAGITRHVQDTDSITEALKRCGIEDYFRDTTRVTVRMPRRDEAQQLRQPINRPVLITESVDVNEEGEAISFGRAVWAGDRVQLLFDASQTEGLSSIR